MAGGGDHTAGMVTAALSCMKSKQSWKKSAPEELGMPVGTGTSGTVMRGSIPSHSQRRKSGAMELMVASEADEQGCSLYIPAWGSVWEWQKTKRPGRLCCRLLSIQRGWEMLSRCHVNARALLCIQNSSCLVFSQMVSVSSLHCGVTVLTYFLLLLPTPFQPRVF